MDIREEARNILPEVIKWRRDLHRIPETGFDLLETVSYIKSVLESLGIPFTEQQGCKCGLVGTIRGSKGGRTVAVRADMDALPMREETGLDFASINGNMHACGHDAHMAVLLGVARLLMGHRSELAGEVKLIFQPAEELGTGALKMIESGALDGVDLIVGMHVGALADDPRPGQMLFWRGRMMACMDRFRITVHGKGSHGSTPERSIDPVVVGSQIVTALQSIVSRELSPQEPCVVSVCRFQAGSAFNIIPDKAELEGTIRAFSNETREYLKKRIGELSEAVAVSMRAEISYEFDMLPPPVVNDPEVASELYNIAKDLYPDNVTMMKKGIMGGEDFSRYLEKVQGSFFLLQNPNNQNGELYLNHHPKFDIDESVLDRGIAVMSQYVIKQLR